MKSYYQFLESTNAPGAVRRAARKPVFRSSAIFPVIQDLGITSRVLFMGYWGLKREIHELALLCTLRAAKGGILLRKSLTISSAAAVSLEISDYLAEAGVCGPFSGSLELEVFSTRDLVFPYPALVLCY